jgi:hypothetical protein
MIDLHRKFQTALKDTVDEWKKRKQVDGIFTYGSVVKGTATASSDLDLVIVWDGEEAPVRLMAEHKGIIVDMDFIPKSDIEDILGGKEFHAYAIAGVISRLKNARVEYDRNGNIKKWLERARNFYWPSEIVSKMKGIALEGIDRSEKYVSQGDTISAVHEMREGIFDLSRLILMRNNAFDIIRPSEVLSDIRIEHPMMYQLFLKTFRLRDLRERQLLEILGVVKEWLERTVERFEGTENLTADSSVWMQITQAQRNYYGAQNLTLGGDYELAVLEMRTSIIGIGQALLTLQSAYRSGSSFMTSLRENEPEFYNKVALEYGAYDLLPKGVLQGIGEARFIAQRL